MFYFLRGGGNGGRGGRENQSLSPGSDRGIAGHLSEELRNSLQARHMFLWVAATLDSRKSGYV